MNYIGLLTKEEKSTLVARLLLMVKSLQLDE